MIIDCHGHYTTEPAAFTAFRKQQIAHFEDPSAPAPKLGTISDDEIRESVEANQLRALRERGADMTIFSPARQRHGPSHRRPRQMSIDWSRLSNDLIHRVTQIFPDNFIGVCQLPQSPDAPIANIDRRARALRHRARLRRLQPEPRPLGRDVDRPAAHRPKLVSVLREDGRAGRPGDDPRLGIVQRQLPRHRRALHQRRHHGLHAVPAGRPVRRLPRPAAHHPAWRRGGALPLGPLPWAGRHAGQAASCPST